MKGQVVLITGCSSGFGNLMVEPLALRDFTVYATMRDMETRNIKPADRLRHLATNRNLPVRVVEMDVTSNQQIERVMTRIEREEGRLDIVINNAFLALSGVMEALTIDQFHAAVETNFMGPFCVNRAALPMMRRQGDGLLIHISSVGGRIVIPYMGVYCATKFALEAMAEAFRYELAPFGIDSVIVEPGSFDTGVWEKAQYAADGGRLAEYGEYAKGVDQVRQGILASYEMDEIPTDPQLVVDAILEVISTPPGKRPIRTVVGDDAGVRQMNNLMEPFAQKVVEGFGFGHLLELKPKEK